MYREDEISHLLRRWAAAVESRDPDRVISLYAEDALLVPTLSNNICRGLPEIRQYFVEFMQKKAMAEIGLQHTHLYGDIATCSGFYTFTFSPDPGDSFIVDARFTFVYRRFSDGWLIVEHHSSRMPE